jgi:uncharacterized lipoprotein YmbA
MKRVAAILVGLALAACSTPEPRYYVLDVSPDPPASPATGAPVLLTVIAIPVEVDRPQMVLGTAANEVVIDDGHRWASPLQPAITQALARGMASVLGEDRVTTDGGGAKWTGYRVDVRVVAFDSRLDREARVEARWQVRYGEGTRTGMASVREPAAAGFDGLAQAHSRALSRLAAQIAATLPESSTPSRLAR